MIIFIDIQQCLKLYILPPLYVFVFLLEDPVDDLHEEVCDEDGRGEDQDDGGGVGLAGVGLVLSPVALHYAVTHCGEGLHGWVHLAVQN